MDFELNDTQLMFQKMARDFVTREVKPVVMELDQKCDPREAIALELTKKGIAQDFHKLVVPEKYGGLGLDAFTACLMMEEIAAGDLGYANTWHVNNTAIGFIFNYGSQAIIDKFIPMITDGEGGIGALSTCEPDSGTTSANLVDPQNFYFATTARQSGSDWILNGNKAFCTNGGMPICKWVLTFARTDMTKTGMASTGGFVFPTNAPGYKIMGEENKMGMRTSSTHSIKFDNLRVPDADRLMGGVRQVNYEHDSAIAAMSIGCARSAYEAALEYSKKRVILGKSISKYELIQAKLSDMYIGLEAARSLMYRAAGYASTHPTMDYRLGRAVKIFASETAQKVVFDALQIFGGAGYSKGMVVEKAHRDIRIATIFEGANEVLRVSLAQLLEANS